MLVVSILSPALAALMLLVFCLKNYKNNISTDLRKYSVLMGVIFGTFGYSMRIASQSGDLITYFSQIDNYSSVGFIESIVSDSDGLFLRGGLFSFVGRTGNNYVLPFIVGFVIYTIVFYVLFDLVRRSKREFTFGELFWLSIIVIGILAPYSIIGNVRCVLSYVLVSFAVYRDTVQKKRNLATFLLYLLPIGLHSTATVVVIIRILSIVVERFERIKWVLLSVILLFPYIVDFFYEHISSISNFFLSDVVVGAVNKAYSYLHWTSGGWATQVESSISSKLVKIFGTIFIVLMLYILLKKTPKKDLAESSSISREPMVMFLFCVSIFALGCLHIKTGAFWRFESIVVLFSPVILVRALERGYEYKRIFHIVSTYAFILVFYNIAYQISNLDFAETMINFLTTPGVKIIYELCNGLIHLIG